MNIFALSALLTFIIIIFLGIYSYNKNSANLINKIFLVYAFVIAFAAIAEYNLIRSSSLSEAQFWVRIVSFWPIVEATNMIFVMTYTTEVKNRVFLLKILLLLIPTIIFIILTQFTSLVIVDPRQASWGWSYVIQHSGVPFILDLWVSGVFIYSTIRLFRFFRSRTDSLERKQAKIIFLTNVFLLILEFIVYGIFYLLKIEFPDITSVVFFVEYLGYTYGIRRYKLFKISVIDTAEDIIATMTDGLLLIDMKNKILLSNDSISKMIGYNASELQGENSIKLLQIDVLSLINQKKLESDEKFNISDVESVALGKNGKKIPVSISTSIIKDTENSSRGAIIIIRDITERKLAENRLKELFAKHDAILEAIGDGLFVVDNENNIILINSAFTNTLGWKEEEVLNQPFVKVIPMEDEKGDPVLPKFRLQPFLLIPGKTIKSKKYTYTSQTNTYYYVRKDKTRFPVLTTSTPIILNNKIIGTVEIFRDVTYEKDVDRAKSEFVSIASHQLRTPLTAIKWYMEVLLAQKKGKLNEKQLEYLKEINHGTEEMINLINSLLNVSRLEMGTVTINPHKVDLIVLLNNAIFNLKPLIKQKSISIIKDIKLDSFSAFLDPSLMGIILDNILSNAVKYSKKSGKVIVKFEKTNKYFVISVKDEGIGIPIEQQSKIFSKLFRADNARITTPEGSGLGLYIVKLIVDNSGGELYFTSEKGKGSTFSVKYPLSGMKEKIGTKTLENIKLII